MRSPNRERDLGELGGLHGQTGIDEPPREPLEYVPIPGMSTRVIKMTVKTKTGNEYLRITATGVRRAM